MAKPPLDPIIVENGKGDGRLANPPSADESDWSEVLGEIDYVLDQLVTSEEIPWWWGWGYPRRARCKGKTPDAVVVGIADLT